MKDFRSFRNPRIILALTYDIVIAALSFWLALFLRLGSYDLHNLTSSFLTQAFVLSEIILVFSFIVNGLYQGVWRFSSTHDLMRVIKASFIGIVLTVVACFFLNRMQTIPRSMFPIQFLLLVVGLGGGRFFYRFMKDWIVVRGKFSEDGTKNIVIVGAGRAGEKLLRDINATPSLNLKVVGFLDDDPYKKNATIHNAKVFGGIQQLPTIVKNLNVHKVFIAVPSASGDEIKRIVSFCNETDVEVKILPKMDHMLSSQVEISLLRNIKIEDLLGRDQVELDLAHLQSMIENKVVLVTGAGGSIGKELCLQIAKFSPSLLILVDSCELFMYELEMKFREHHQGTAFYPKILDIRNADKVEDLFSSYRPAVVFHAAAYKHVSMMEFNPGEAIETNILGTKIVAEASMKFGAEKFIMISTDKAVNPTNIMGVSKRVAEMVITGLHLKNSKTRFISVRFGNVLGSNGSVIPLFRKQIEERRDVTVTHPDVIRYFMSIPEASQLVLQAGSMGSGGEIYVLDMGEPVKIVDLAKEMIRLSGLVLDRDIKISYSGLRPGEKLFEELFTEEESFEHTNHGKIRKCPFRDLDARFEERLEKLLKYKSSEAKTLVYLLKELVPEFTHYLIESEEKESTSINH